MNNVKRLMFLLTPLLSVTANDEGGITFPSNNKLLLTAWET